MRADLKIVFKFADAILKLWKKAVGGSFVFSLSTPKTSYLVLDARCEYEKQLF